MADGFERAASRRLPELGPAGAEIDLAAFGAMFNLFRVSTRILYHLESAVHRPLGLSLAGFRVLFVVWVFGSLEPREIAKLAGVTRAAVSSALNTLERDGLARRTRSTADRRMVSVELTSQGQSLLAEAYQRQHHVERTLFANLDVDELNQFTATLRYLMVEPLPSVPQAGDEGRV